MIKNIIFDFDGVIIDSVPVKTEAYRRLFNTYENNLVSKLIEYHELNGGISRYKKIKYFFNEIIKKEILEDDILLLANRYSDLTKEELSQKKYLIEDCLHYITQNYENYNMHIASGADNSDLIYICDKLDLKKYFLSIQGSPMVKSDIVKEIIYKNNYKTNETILIGDSINDYEAANQNEIEFYGYNNLKLLEKSKYIKNFSTFSL